MTQSHNHYYFTIIMSSTKMVYLLTTHPIDDIAVWYYIISHKPNGIGTNITARRLRPVEFSNEHMHMCMPSNKLEEPMEEIVVYMNQFDCVWDKGQSYILVSPRTMLLMRDTYEHYNCPRVPYSEDGTMTLYYNNEPGSYGR